MPKLAPCRPLESFPGDVLSVEEAAQVLGVGKNAVYEAVRQGQIRALRLGFIRIPKAALQDLLSGSAPGMPESERPPLLRVVNGR